MERSQGRQKLKGDLGVKRNGKGDFCGQTEGVTTAPAGTAGGGGAGSDGESASPFYRWRISGDQV